MKKRHVPIFDTSSGATEDLEKLKSEHEELRREHHELQEAFQESQKQLGKVTEAFQESQKQLEKFRIQAKVRQHDELSRERISCGDRQPGLSYTTRKMLAARERSPENIVAASPEQGSEHSAIKPQSPLPKNRWEKANSSGRQASPLKKLRQQSREVLKDTLLMRYMGRRQSDSVLVMHSLRHSRRARRWVRSRSDGCLPKEGSIEVRTNKISELDRKRKSCMRAACTWNRLVKQISERERKLKDGGDVHFDVGLDAHLGGESSKILADRADRATVAALKKALPTKMTEPPQSAPLKDLYAKAQEMLRDGKKKEVTRNFEWSDLLFALATGKLSPDSWTGPDTPLQYAVMNGQMDLLKALVVAKANMDMPDANGIGVLHVAVYEAPKDDTVELLLRGLANPNASDAHGQTPLFFTGSSSMCELLCEHRADVNHVNANGQSALHFATKAGLEDVTSWLCERMNPSSLHQQDQFGASASYNAKGSGMRKDVRDKLDREFATTLSMRGAQTVQGGPREGSWECIRCGTLCPPMHVSCCSCFADRPTSGCNSSGASSPQRSSPGSPMQTHFSTYSPQSDFNARSPTQTPSPTQTHFAWQAVGTDGEQPQKKVDAASRIQAAVCNLSQGKRAVPGSLGFSPTQADLDSFLIQLDNEKKAAVAKNLSGEHVQVSKVRAFARDQTAQTSRKAAVRNREAAERLGKPLETNIPAAAAKPDLLSASIRNQTASRHREASRARREQKKLERKVQKLQKKEKVGMEARSEAVEPAEQPTILGGFFEAASAASDARRMQRELDKNLEMVKKTVPDSIYQRLRKTVVAPTEQDSYSPLGLSPSQIDPLDSKKGKVTKVAESDSSDSEMSGEEEWCGGAEAADMPSQVAEQSSVQGGPLNVDCASIAQSSHDHVDGEQGSRSSRHASAVRPSHHEDPGNSVADRSSEAPAAYAVQGPEPRTKKQPRSSLVVASPEQEPRSSEANASHDQAPHSSEAKTSHDQKTPSSVVQPVPDPRNVQNVSQVSVTHVSEKQEAHSSEANAALDKKPYTSEANFSDNQKTSSSEVQPVPDVADVQNAPQVSVTHVSQKQEPHSSQTNAALGKEPYTSEAIVSDDQRTSSSEEQPVPDTADVQNAPQVSVRRVSQKQDPHSSEANASHDQESHSSAPQALPIPETSSSAADQHTELAFQFSEVLEAPGKRQTQPRAVGSGSVKPHSAQMQGSMQGEDVQIAPDKPSATPSAAQSMPTQVARSRNDSTTSTASQQRSRATPFVTAGSRSIVKLPQEPSEQR